MTKTINIHEAKTNFSKLIARVINGEEITISKAGSPVAKLVPVVSRQVNRTPGSAKGLIKISDDFEAPLSDELISEFDN